MNLKKEITKLDSHLYYKVGWIRGFGTMILKGFFNFDAPQFGLNACYFVARFIETSLENQINDEYVSNNS